MFLFCSNIGQRRIKSKSGLFGLRMGRQGLPLIALVRKLGCGLAENGDPAKSSHFGRCLELLADPASLDAETEGYGDVDLISAQPFWHRRKRCCPIDRGNRSVIEYLMARADADLA